MSTLATKVCRSLFISCSNRNHHVFGTIPMILLIVIRYCRWRLFAVYFVIIFFSCFHLFLAFLRLTYIDIPDHLALMIELLGPMPKQLAKSGRHAKNLV